MMKLLTTFRLLQVVPVVGLLGMLCAGCSGNTTDTPELPTKPDDGNPLSMPIAWQVKSGAAQDSRGMIENDSLLREACTPLDMGGEGKSIGIWSAYELPDGVKKLHILNNPNGDVSLTYREGTEWDNWEGWTYGEEATHWTYGAKYTFNAYYPMSAVDEISTSDFTTFVIDYNTEHFQEDLMMAYAYVDTYAMGFNPTIPIPLNFLHVLSAVKFQFLFMNEDGTTYDDADRITACWMENSQYGSGVATTAMLAFGTVTDEGIMDGEHIHWYAEDYPLPSTASNPRKIYFWEDPEGVAFSSTEHSYEAGTTHSTDPDGMQRFGKNDGWTLIIPQEMDGSVLLGFRLATTGSMEHRIHLPATVFEPGKRYTYHIRFGMSRVDVKLSIASWNELKSSHNIPL